MMLRKSLHPFRIFLRLGAARGFGVLYLESDGNY